MVEFPWLRRVIAMWAQIAGEDGTPQYSKRTGFPWMVLNFADHKGWHWNWELVVVNYILYVCLYVPEKT